MSHTPSALGTVLNLYRQRRGWTLEDFANALLNYGWQPLYFPAANTADLAALLRVIESAPADGWPLGQDEYRLFLVAARRTLALTPREWQRLELAAAQDLIESIGLPNEVLRPPPDP